MKADVSFGDGSEILGIAIQKYKNLSNIWMPWSDGIALFGANGAGKTNLLEALAMLIGDDITMSLIRARVFVEPGDISIIMRPDLETLPSSGPDTLESMVKAFDREPGAPKSVAPIVAWARGDASWWKAIGASAGQDAVSGIQSSALPQIVKEYLIELLLKPTVQYCLSEFQYIQGRYDTSWVLKRVFRRTLVVQSVPAQISDFAEELPSIFEPLKQYLRTGAVVGGGWIGILDLPPTITPPASMQWFPRPRTMDEIAVNLQHEFTVASPSIMSLMAHIAELPLEPAPAQEDFDWILHEIGEKAAMRELTLTQPGIVVSSVGGGSADYDISTVTGLSFSILEPEGDHQLSRLSAAQRRWVDEAMGSLGRELRRFGQQSQWQASIFSQIDDDRLFTSLLEVAHEVEDIVRHNEFWNFEALDELLRVLDAQFAETGRKYLAEMAGSLALPFALQATPGLGLLRPATTVRVFDEPEAHLHPAAQRRIASALEALRRRGQHVVIASHSPIFLDLPNWQLVNVGQTEGHSNVSTLSRQDFDARQEVASQLGINRGDLLAGIDQILIVEGVHDQLVIQTLFGDSFRQQGIAILRMHGTGNLLATAELDFIDQYLDVPVSILLDYVKIGRIEKGDAHSEEEKALMHLRQSCKRKGRQYKTLGLERPDITAYLSETAVRSLVPSFPGWRAVLHRFEALKKRPSFKTWLRDEYEVDLTQTRHIKSVLDLMIAEHLSPAGDLSLKLNGYLASLHGSE